MALAGIILQAVAGMVYGLSYLIGVERIDKWKESRRAWLNGSKNRIKLSYLSTFITPLVLVLLLYRVVGEDSTPWYFLLLGFLVSWLIIVSVYTSFLLIWSKSKSIPDMLNSPRLNQMMQKSNIASVTAGVILMALGGVGIRMLGDSVTISNMVSILLLALALTALVFGFILATMSVLYYVYILFVRLVGILLKPGKAVWILALSLYLAGCALLIANELHNPS